MNLQQAIYRLVAEHGSVRQAAKATKLHRSTLYNYMCTTEPKKIQRRTLKKLGLKQHLTVYYTWVYG